MATRSFEKYLISGAIGIVVIIWLFYLSKYSFNIPRTADDVRFFFHQFTIDYLDKDSWIDRVRYLGLISNWPHTKIIGRVIQIIQFHIEGTVNFRSIVIAGTLMLLPLIYFLSKIASSHRTVIGLVLSSWLLIPVFNSYWSIFSVSFAGNLLVSAIILWSALDRKWILFLCGAILSVFIHGHIAIVPFIGVGLFGIKQFLIDKKPLSKKEYLIIVIALISTLLLFYFHIINNPVRRIDQGFATQVAFLPKLISTCIYVTTFCSKSISSLIFGKSYHSLGLVVAVPILFYSILLTILTLKRGSKASYVTLGMIALCVVSALISGWVRNDGLTYLPLISPRYESWSILFLSLVSVLSIQYWKDRRYVTLIILSLSIIIYVGRMIKEIPMKESIAKQRITFLGDMVGDFKYLSKGDKIMSQRIKSAIKNDIYEPNLDQQLIEKNVKRQKIKESENEKIEIVKYSTSEIGTIITIGFNGKVFPSKKFYFYSLHNGEYDIYKPIQVSIPIGLKQGFDNQILKPDIPRLELLTCLLPSGAEEIGILQKKKDHYVILKSTSH